MEKRSFVDQIEITRDGTIQIRIAKEIVDDDGTTISQTWHRTAVPPGGDIDQQMQAVNAHLQSMKQEPVKTDCTDRVKAAANAMWTGKVVSEFAAKQAAAVPSNKSQDEAILAELPKAP